MADSKRNNRKGALESITSNTSKPSSLSPTSVVASGFKTSPKRNSHVSSKSRTVLEREETLKTVVSNTAPVDDAELLSTSSIASKEPRKTPSHVIECKEDCASNPTKAKGLPVSPLTRLSTGDMKSHDERCESASSCHTSSSASMSALSFKSFLYCFTLLESAVMAFSSV